MLAKSIAGFGKRLFASNLVSRVFPWERGWLASAHNTMISVWNNLQILLQFSNRFNAFTFITLNSGLYNNTLHLNLSRKMLERHVRPIEEILNKKYAQVMYNLYSEILS